MNENITEPYLTGIKEFLLNRLGLHYSSLRENELGRKLKEAALNFGYDTTISFIQWLLRTDPSRRDMEKLASYLTIGETYFLREIEAYEYLKEEFLKQYFYNNRESNRKLTVWSAGCSSGEEVYSIAGLIREILPDYAKWEIKITGTDINPSALEKARKGIYSRWSFRKTPQWFMKYVEDIDEHSFKIKDSLRSMVKFTSHNLATDPQIFRGLNIIFCRNVLIYFPASLISKVTKGFYEAMAETGVLVLSPVEVSLNICGHFNRITYLGRTFFIKESGSKNMCTETETIEESFLEQIKPEPEVILEEDEFERIKFMFEEGMYLRVENLINQKAENTSALPLNYQVLLAQTYASQGKLKKAESMCKQIAESGNCHSSILLLQVRMYIRQKRVKVAQQILEEILQREPDNIMANYQLGLLENQLGTHSQSKWHLSLALEILNKLSEDESVQEAEGLTVDQLKEKILSVLEEGYNEAGHTGSI